MLSETNLKLWIPCSKCMHRPMMSQADACTSQAYTCMYCMHCPIMSQADACNYCMGYVVLFLSRIYPYLQLHWVIVLFLVMFCNFYLLKNYKTGKNSRTVKTREKIIKDSESLDFLMHL